MPCVDEKVQKNPWNNLVLATVFFGANDAVFAGEKQHVPIEEYKTNIKSIVNHIRAVAGSHVAIILVTPPAVDSVQWPTRSSNDTSKYADIIRALSCELNTFLLDLWLPSSESNMELTDFRDGLHFNESGNSKMCNGIKNIIRREILFLCPEDNSPISMEMHFPAHAFLGDAKHLPEDSGESNYFATLISSWEWKK